MDQIKKIVNRDLAKIDATPGVPDYVKAASKKVVRVNYRKLKARPRNYQLKNRGLTKIKPDH